jgi:hypothetical protein
MEEYNMKIDAEGNVSAERQISERESTSKLSEILEMINNPDIPPGPIKRLIATEIASVNLQMLRQQNDPLGIGTKQLSEQVKALRELGKEVMEADIMSKKDFLNIDGKKFQYALRLYREGATEAMKTAKLDESTINSILNHWRDIMTEKEDEIRRAIDRMDSSK